MHSEIHPHQRPAEPQPTAPRKRTSAERQRQDNYSRPCRWANVTTRSREGKLIRDTRADLIRHVGTDPSVTQRVLIERAVMLTVYLARMDSAALKGGTLSEHAAARYLAFSNTLGRTMKLLGMKATPTPYVPPHMRDWSLPKASAA